MIDLPTINKIRDAANVVDVLGDFMELEPKGKGIYECLCPFHADRHVGSFKVSKVKNIYHCFSCGAGGNSIDFLMHHEKMSFVDALAYIGKMYGIEVEGSDKFTPKQHKPNQPAPKLPMLRIPFEQVKAQKAYVDTNFVAWLRSLPWNEEEHKRLEKNIVEYGLGGTKDGMVVYWQIDQEGNVRTGKMMRYEDDGHRVKTKGYNNDWMHAALERIGRINLDECDYKTTFFGMHLLEFYGKATVRVVESEKSALLAATFWGNTPKTLWMASGGKNCLKQEVLKEFISRKRTVYLYPDRDAINDWTEYMKGLNNVYVRMPFDDIANLYTKDDGPTADIGDVVIRLLYQRQQMSSGAALESMKKTNDNLQALIDNLQLEIV